VPVLLL